MQFNSSSAQQAAGGNISIKAERLLLRDDNNNKPTVHIIYISIQLPAEEDDVMLLYYPTAGFKGLTRSQLIALIRI